MVAVPRIRSLFACSYVACKTNARSTDSITVWTGVVRNGNDLISSPFLPSSLCSTTSFTLKETLLSHSFDYITTSIESLISEGIGWHLLAIAG